MKRKYRNHARRRRRARRRTASNEEWVFEELGQVMYAYTPRGILVGGMVAVGQQIAHYVEDLGVDVSQKARNDRGVAYGFDDPETGATGEFSVEFDGNGYRVTAEGSGGLSHKETFGLDTTFDKMSEGASYAIEEVLFELG